MSCRVLLLDDHVATRIGLEKILSESLEGCVFSHAAGSRLARELASSDHWDLVILGLALPGRGGLELITDLKTLYPSLKILVYSMFPEDQMGIRALRAGADGYLTKDSPAETIPKAVKSVLSGERYVSAKLAALLVQNMRRGGTSALDTLSDREYQVLQQIASGKTPSQIAESMVLSVKTVSTYRSRILEKLRLRTTADLIRYALDHGVE